MSRILSILSIVSLAAFMLLAMGCPKQGSSVGMGPGLPAWAGHISGPANFLKGKGIYAKGIGKSRLTQAAMSEACDYARLEVTKFLRSKIDGASEIYMTSVSDGERENAGKIFEQGAKNGLDVAMSGFGCVATFQNPKDENEYWILGFLDPSSVEGLYDEMEKALDNLPKEKEEQLKKDWSSFRERNKIGD